MAWARLITPGLDDLGLSPTSSEGWSSSCSLLLREFAKGSIISMWMWVCDLVLCHYMFSIPLLQCLPNGSHLSLTRSSYKCEVGYSVWGPWPRVRRPPRAVSSLWSDACSIGFSLYAPSFLFSSIRFTGDMNSYLFCLVILCLCQLPLRCIECIWVVVLWAWSLSRQPGVGIRRLALEHS
jgi:hypothetical protein